MTQDPVTALTAALICGHELDLAGGELPASALVTVLTAARPAGAPALRLRRRRRHRPGRSARLHLRRGPGPEDVGVRRAVGAGCRVPALRCGGMRVRADPVLGNGFTAHGRVHLTDARVGDSLRLSAEVLHGTDGRTMIADRIVIGGTCYMRRFRSDGEVRLPGARITGNLDLSGATLDCSDAHFDRPRFRPHAEDRPPEPPGPLPMRPSLDARAATVGEDLLLLRVTATGGIRIRRVDARTWVQVVDATLGGPGARHALNAYGLTTVELELRPARRPVGAVRQKQARVGAFHDSENLWADTAVGDVLLGGFVYETLNDTHVVDVQMRIDWVEGVSSGYAPGSHAQPASAHRRGRARRTLRTRTHQTAAPTLRRGRPDGPDLGRTTALDGRVRLSPLVGGLLTGGVVGAGQHLVRVRRAAPDRRRPESGLESVGLRRRHVASHREPRAGRIRAIGRCIAVDRRRARRRGRDSGHDGCSGRCANTQTCAIGGELHPNGGNRAEKL